MKNWFVSLESSNDTFNTGGFDATLKMYEDCKVESYFIMTDKEVASKKQTTSSKRLIHVSITDTGVVVFKFDKLSRTAFAEYLAYIRKYAGQYPDPLRMIYDFRGAGLPGLPFIEMHSEVMEGIEIPDHTRWVHLVDKRIYGQFVKTLNARMPVEKYEHSSFTDETEAIEWLMRPFDQDKST